MCMNEEALVLDTRSLVNMTWVKKSQEGNNTFLSRLPIVRPEGGVGMLGYSFVYGGLRRLMKIRAILLTLNLVIRQLGQSFHRKLKKY